MNLNLIFSTTPQSFPAGTAGGMYDAQILDSDGVTAVSGPQAAIPGTNVTFSNIPAGSYVAKVKRWNAAGNAVLGSTTQAFNLSAPADVLIDIPTSIAVNLNQA